MNEVIRFALLGLGVGALYAFASQGLIVIYRGTGVLNFSLGATAIAGVFMQWELQYQHGWPFLAAAIVGIALSAFLGILTHWVIMRPLRTASSLVRVIATLGDLRFLDTTTAQPAPAAASKLWDTASTTPSAQAVQVAPHAATAADDDEDLKAGVVVGEKRSQAPVAATAGSAFPQ